MVKLMFLGKFRGLARDDLDTPLPNEVRTLGDLKGWVVRRDPLLGDALKNTRTRLVLNQAVVDDLMLTVSDADEVAFLPPMSGG